MRRAGGRRLYRSQDIALLRGIKRLLHEEGYTTRGVQKILRADGVDHVAAIGRGEIAPSSAGTTGTEGSEAIRALEDLIDDVAKLQAVIARLS